MPSFTRISADPDHGGAGEESDQIHEVEISRLQSRIAEDRLSISEVEYRLILSRVWDTPRGYPKFTGIAELELARLKIGLLPEQALRIEDEVRQAFIAYKALGGGVPVHRVDPRNTSRTCPACGSIDKANRKTQAWFICTSCGFAGLADVIAAGNIASRALVNAPYVSEAAGRSSQGQAQVLMKFDNQTG